MEGDYADIWGIGMGVRGCIFQMGGSGKTSRFCTCDVNVHTY